MEVMIYILRYYYTTVFFYFFRHTIPQGEWKWLNSEDYPYPNIFTLKYTFDFFNYAGIHRPVLLYTLPKQIHLEDIEVVTDEIDVENNRATVSYNLDYFSSQVVMGSGVAKIRFEFQK